jgi:hypothetical protein
LIQSNHTVSGRAIDAPRLVIDNGHVYWGSFESPTRYIFQIPDDEPPWGATLFWGNKAERYAYFDGETRIDHIPSQPGAYEGLPMAYASSLSRLTVSADGLHLLEDGKPWTWAMMTGFSDYYFWLTGRHAELRAAWTQARDLGANGRRVLGMMAYIAPFDPREFGQRWFDELPAFAADAEAYQQRLHFDVFADNQIYKLGTAFWNQFCEVARPIASMIPGAGNEHFKNGFDPYALAYPGVLSSQGSATADAAPPMPGWGVRMFHGRRDYPKVFMSFDDAIYVGRGLDASGTSYAPFAPIAHDEPMGFAEIDIPNRRSTDPNLAACLMLTGKAYGCGATFHSEDGIYSRLLGPVQQRCARAFFAEK